jgi:glutathione S-transferase
MPTLYGVLGSPFVRKVVVALAEKSMTYDREDVLPITGVNVEFRKMSPLGKIPAYRDGDRTLADSSVIIAYLEKIKPEPSLYPSDAYEYARALWFEEYGDSGMIQVAGQIFFQKVVAPRFLNQPTDETVVDKLINEGLPKIFDYLEAEIGNREWLVGNRF